ncbi:MAG: IPT/TIG domain-containing protein, partial [bacterium]
MKAAITDVAPRSGPTSGGTFVQIRGHKLDNGTGYWCKFGDQTVPATLNTTHLLVECVTPPLLKNGSVEVEVSISGGVGSDPDPQAEWTVSHGHHTFHYYAPPTIMGIDPSIGPATGG